MVLGIFQTRQILDLKSQLLAARTDATRLRESNALTDLRLATLDPKDASYASSQVVIAWDPYRHEGVVAMKNMPATPTGHDYQLWVLDPGAEAPISSGLLTGSRPFTVPPVSTPKPGFAVSLEPAGGSPEPTGPILFAVAPGP
jgi:anti-sigma-K factor RskA